MTAGNSSMDSDATTPHKVHIRGVDELTTADIKAFSIEHFPSNDPVRVEWIDDTSANIVFDTPATGLRALENFATQKPLSLPVLQLQPAKPLSSRPEVGLQVRLAIATDQKRARAHEASRFYMMHPEYDPREQRRKGRDAQSNGDYRRRRYGDDENRRRKRRDKMEGFDASMYDDNDSSGRRSSMASSSSDGRRHRHLDSYRPNGARSRDRSASPDAANSRSRRRTPPPSYRSRDPFPFPSENEGKELFPSKSEKQKNVEKDLFPLKSNTVVHRRSDAFDAADETADLFAHKMAVPWVDGAREGRSLADRISVPASKFGRLKESDPEPEIAAFSDEEDAGVSIRGASRVDQGLSIRGGANVTKDATAGRIKELFPNKTSGNAGKELFAERLQGRGGRRNRAEDMFS